MKIPRHFPNSGRLMTREVDIIRLVSVGYSDREVGEQLSITRGTVRTFMRSIFVKLWVEDRQQLATFALKPDLVRNRPEPSIVTAERKLDQVALRLPPAEVIRVFH